MVKKGRIFTFLAIVIALFVTFGLSTGKIAKNINLGLDLQGGFEILYEVKPIKEGDKITPEVLKSTSQTLDSRSNVLGVSESSIAVEGDNRIRVQLPGVKDQNKAREILSTEANLTFRDVNDKVLLDGSDLVEGGASQGFDQLGRPSVSLKLKDAKKFGEVTKSVLEMAPNNLLVIWLDFEEGKDSYQAEAAKAEPKFLSAASVNQVFNQSEVSIEGPNFTAEEAQQISRVLNAGALPVQLEEVYSDSVGASFGEKALDQTILAGVIGILIIFAFMIYFYRVPGVVATVMLCLYLYLTLLVFDWMNATLTLPGIAAIILGVGIAVDANIITYERIKDELKLGKSTMAAFRAGNQRSLSTILDANLTTLLAAAVMFFYGTSSVKGFATSLIVSILVSFITNLWGSRLLLSLLVQSKWLNKKPTYFGVKQSEVIPIEKSNMHFPPTRFDHIDFVKVGMRLLKVSVIVTIVGIIVLSVFKLNLGIDFSSGTRIDVRSEQSLTADEVQTEFEKLKIEPEDVVLAGDNNEVGVVTLKGVLSADEIAKMKTHFDEKYGYEPNVSTVTPMIGKELARNAMFAVAIASVGIILYVTIRFEWTIAVSAIIALIHDAFFIVAFFSLFRLEVDLTFIAAVLTIVGYSINDSIVTFDRIRENMKLRKRIRGRDDLVEIVNESVRQTLGRSVNTVVTVIIAVIALLIFGSESITNFSIALLVGLVVGMYSSIFIASQLWIILKTRQLKRKGEQATEATVKDEPQV